MDGRGKKRASLATRHFRHRTPKRHSLSNYVDSIREGLKKIGGCQDVEEIVDAATTKYSDTHGRVSQRNSRGKHCTNNGQVHTESQPCSFEEYNKCIPVLDSMSRTIDWVHHSQLESDSKISLAILPMRGTLLPTRYEVGQNYPYYRKDSTLTSVSSCEDARGTHGRGTPPSLDPELPRLDELFQQLQAKQENEARRLITASGQQHLLSINLCDVYSHQVAGMPIGTTPEILPFMAPPTRLLKQKNFELRKTRLNKKPPSSLEVHKYSCRWLGCVRQFCCAKELFAHVDQYHIQAYKTAHQTAKSYKMICKWDNCNRSYYVRYKLLLHVHNHHCKESCDQAVRLTSL